MGWCNHKDRAVASEDRVLEQMSLMSPYRHCQVYSQNTRPEKLMQNILYPFTDQIPFCLRSGLKLCSQKDVIALYLSDIPEPTDYLNTLAARID